MSHIVSDFLRAWQRKCGRNWTILLSIVGGLVVFYGAYTQFAPVVAEMRPWATRFELSRVAENVYPSRIEEKKLEIVIIKKRIEFLESLGSGMDAIQQQELRDFNRQLFRAQDELTDLSRERAYFELWKQRQ